MIQGKRAYVRCVRTFAIGVAIAALSSGIAHAQTATDQSDKKGASQAARVRLDIGGGRLGDALLELGHRAGVQIVFLPKTVEGRRAKAIHGVFSVEEALDRLLAPIGLRYRKTDAGYIVGGPSQEAMDQAGRIVRNLEAQQGIVNGRSALPDILVTARRWTLNTDIERTPDDPQPYVVFTHEQIARSGSQSLEDFFRNYLGANTTGSLSTQQRFSNSRSVINLRGFGTGGTLILLDGRRFAEVNTGDGALSQASINGIPLDSIERIEVLASSASGIYGSNAVGGVINIITRRDYHGIEFNAYIGDTTRLDGVDKRLSLNGSFPIEHGKTRISFTGSWQQTDGLFTGDRDFVERGRAKAVANDPNFFNEIGLIDSTTPNIASQSGANLVLKPQYGGTNLGSSVTYIPVGFAGAGQAGTQALINALIANAGQENIAQGSGAVGGAGGNGKGVYLLTPTKTYSGSLAFRRQFNKWLSVYGEIGYTHYENPTLAARTPTTVTLQPTAVNNPFQQTITVAVPDVGPDFRTNNISNTLRALGGVIAKLPYGWQAFFDVNWSRGTYRSVGAPPGIDVATQNALNNGTLDVLRDVTQFPLSYTFLDSTYGTFTTPSRSTNTTFTLKVAGPVPLITFWGGKPVLTLQIEQDRQALGNNLFYVNSTSSSTIGYTPPRSQTTRSAYGEVTIPVVGKGNHVPLIHELEFDIAGRYDSYAAMGANADITCFPTSGGLYAGPIPADILQQVEGACPGTLKIPFARTHNHSINPTIAMKWSVTQDIAFRASYATGYQPPYLNALIRASPQPNALNGLAGLPANVGVVLSNVGDALRGNERVGSSLGLLSQLLGYNVLPAYVGGNPDVLPQTSKSWSAGIILTPHWVPGLRLSADWTLITQNNVYFSPSSLIGGGNLPDGQAAFDAFLAAHPERVTRNTDPSTFGAYGVGPITFIDLSQANLSQARSEAIDFAASYLRGIGPGQLEIQANATMLLDLRLRNTDQSPWSVATGVVGSQFLAGLAALGGDQWKANGTISYTAHKWSVGMRAHYFGGYWYSTNHAVQPRQGSARMPAQAYVDIFASWKILPKTDLSGGVNDVFDKSPPIDAMTNSFYSFFGDPRRATFYINLKQRL